MVKVEDIETMGWRKAIKGMRNPLSIPGGTNNSWDKSDSKFAPDGSFTLGENDFGLACRLIKAGSEHRKFLRMIHVQMDITGPLYWWKEMSTYKVATVENSCSTMHRVHSKEFTLDDFSHERLLPYSSQEVMNTVIASLNSSRLCYLECQDPINKKDWWWQLIQLLPSSYNQLRTWDGSMETILSILHQRAHHKLDTDWEPFRQACFNNIPYCKEFYEAMYDEEEN